MDKGHWDLLYDLSSDTIRVREVQDWSLHKPGLGFPPTPWLFGSDEWWTAVASGEIETRETAGTIQREVRWDQDGQGAVFEVRDTDGISTWPFPGGDPTRYAEGLGIRIRYARCERKADAPTWLDHSANVILRIWIEPSDRRAPLLQFRHQALEDPEWRHSVQSFSPSDHPNAEKA